MYMYMYIYIYIYILQSQVPHQGQEHRHGIRLRVPSVKGRVPGTVSYIAIV